MVPLCALACALVPDDALASSASISGSTARRPWVWFLALFVVGYPLQKLIGIEED
jgi:hypothetical protein